MGGDRLWTLERQTGPECSQTITITRSGGPVLTSCRREDSQWIARHRRGRSYSGEWKERAHRVRSLLGTGVDYRTQRGDKSLIRGPK